LVRVRDSLGTGVRVEMPISECGYRQDAVPEWMGRMGTGTTTHAVYIVLPFIAPSEMFVNSLLWVWHNTLGLLHFDFYDRPME